MTKQFPAVESLIPHERSMVLIDEIIAFSDDEIQCRRTVRSDSLFVDNGTVPATISIEYMAQSIAAYAGYKGHLEGEPVKLAFLLSCRELELLVPGFDEGDVIDIFASPVWLGDDSLGAFACRATRDGQEVARGQLNVYQGSVDSVIERAS